MKNTRSLAASLLLVLLSAAPAWAGHAVWLDFSGFHLDSWSAVNGNDPPKTSDRDAIRKLVIAQMSEDYATFDVTITTAKPKNGRYTRVKILGTDGGGTAGCAGPECCLEGDCTGIGSWNDMTVSALEVYAGSFSDLPEFTDANATTARLANGISGTASHELGHVLGLEHCHAADDSFAVGCDGLTVLDTKDDNPTWHIMASGASWNLTAAQRATRDRFFSVHSERRKIAGAVQLRNHFAPLAGVDGGMKPSSDLVYSRLASPGTMKWFARLSSGSAFGNFSEWSGDAGDAADVFLTGDVDKDGRADLVYGRAVSSTQVTWYVRRSKGDGFGTYSVWAGDAGDAGDVYRLADVDGDKMADLVYGRALGPGTVRWYVRLSNGDGFGSGSTWAEDGGDAGDVFFVADVTGDGKADLVYSRAVTPNQVRWFVRRSGDGKFGPLEKWHDDAGDRGDLLYVGEATGDEMADLVYGRVISSFTVIWYLRKSTGHKFDDVIIWSHDGGDAGDLFRLGDATGDGMVDLMYGRPRGLASLTKTPNLASVRWYGRPSTGGAFGAFSVWAGDAGDEGDCFP